MAEFRAPAASASVPCPECGEPIELSFELELATPESGAKSVQVRVVPVDLTERAQEHGEVCPVLTSGGRDG